MSDAKETYPGDTSSFPRFKKRPGTIDFGLEYEYLITTFVALQLVNRQDVQDFQITNNDMDYGYFDDLIVKVEYLNETSHTFAFQLKHFSRKKILNLRELTSDRGTIRLFPMFESFEHIPKRQDVSCILYTNAAIKFDTNVCISLSKFENQITIVPLEREYGHEVFNTGEIFQLRTLDYGNETEFFEHLYFYCNQMDVQSLKTRLGEMLPDILQDQLLETFLAVMREWWSSPFILTKKDVIIKLAELVFSPFIKTVSSKMYNERCQVLKKVTMNYEITLVRDFNIIEDIWLLPEISDRERQFSNKYIYFQKRLSVPRDLDRIKVLWYMDEMPLILRLDDWNRNIIKNGIELLRHHNILKRLILVGPSQEEFYDFKTAFKNFMDLRHQADNVKLFTDFRVSFQTRKSICMPDLFQSNIEVASIFTVDDLLQMTQEIITIGKQVTNLPKVYLSRVVTALSEQPVNEEDIFTTFNNDINLISSEPGCGKSTLMASLANNCPPQYWSVFVKLREHHSLFKRKPQSEEVLLHFLEIETGSDTLLERAKMAFLKSRKIYLFLDGLDEVEFVEVVLNFVEDIRRQGVCVWMSTRPNLTQLISDRFQINPISIEKFGKTQIKEYFNKVYDKPVDFPYEISINPLEMSLLGYEALSLSRDNFIKLTSGPKLLETFFDINIVDQYNLKKYELLALKFCLEGKALAKMKINSGDFAKALLDIERSDKLKIITKIDEDRAVFENRSFAEYFASVWLARHMGKVRLLEEFLFAEENHNLKKMLDRILARDSVLHLAVIDQNLELVREQITNVHTKDLGGRTVLHLICSYTNVDKDLLELVLDKHDLFEKDHLFSWTSIEYAIRAKNLLAIDKFLEKEKQLEVEFDDIYQPKEVAILATRLGYPNLLSSCIDKNPDIIHCRIGSEQSSLLHIAVSSKHENVETIIEILTEAKIIDPNVKNEKNETALHLVLEDGDCALGRSLVGKGASLSVIGNRGRNLLHFAVSTKKSNVQVIDFLVDGGIDINARDLDGATPLHLVCSEGNFENFIQLCLKGVDLQIRTLYGKSVLHYAIAADEPNLEIINYLIDKGVDTKSPDFRDVTVLHLAVMKGHNEIIDVLIKKDPKILNFTDHEQAALINFASAGQLQHQEFLRLLARGLNIQDEHGMTPLHVACKEGNYNIVKFLLEHEASLISDKKDNNALHYAALSENPNAELVSLLTDNHVNNEKNIYGKTPLHYAAEQGHGEIVELLLEATKNKQISSGKTSLHYAKSAEIAKVLIENGTAVDLGDADGVTALHLAAQRRQFDLVKLLTTTNTNILKAETKDGRNALHFAVSTCARNTEIIDFLLDQDIGIKADHDGITALHVASRFNNNYNVEVLLTRGAGVNALTNRRENALHFAINNIIPNEIMLNLLLDKGINLDQLNDDGKTPIQLACERGHQKVVNFFKAI